MRKAPETDLEFLKEGIAEEIFKREPFAQAIARYLGTLDRKHYSSIMNYLDEVIERDITDLLNKQKERSEAAEV